MCGFFDWFSGYQETGLAKAMGEIADTTVIASDWVNPLFSDEHLQRLGLSRRYRVGRSTEHGVQVVRLPSIRRRALVWSGEAVDAIRDEQPDLVVQVMPGQGLPVAASLAECPLPRVVLYGDNTAMYAGLSQALATAKFAAFAASKGLLYHFINRRAQRLYGYTPNTLTRLRSFTAGRPMALLPLAYDEKVFCSDPALRTQWREDRAISPEEMVVLAAGKVQPQKRLDALVAATAQLRRSGVRMRLIIIGTDDSSTSANLRAQIRNEGLDDAIVEPFQPAGSLNAAFNGADLGVWPMMPAITIQQAMGAGLRVLIPDNDIVGHLVQSPASGRLLPQGSPMVEQLAAGIRAEMASRVDSPWSRSQIQEANAWLSTGALAQRLLREAGIVDRERA